MKLRLNLPRFVNPRQAKIEQPHAVRAHVAARAITTHGGHTHRTASQKRARVAAIRGRKVHRAQLIAARH